MSKFKLQTPPQFKTATVEELRQHAFKCLTMAVENCMAHECNYVFVPLQLISHKDVAMIQIMPFKTKEDEIYAFKCARKIAKKHRSKVSILIQEVWQVKREGIQAEMDFLNNNLRASECDDRTDSLICIIEVEGRQTMTGVVDLEREGGEESKVTGFNNFRAMTGRFYDNLSIVNHTNVARAPPIVH